MAAIEAEADRPEGADVEGAGEPIRLDLARRQYTRLAKALDDEIEHLSRQRDVETDKSRIDRITDLIKQLERALTTVLTSGSKLDARDMGEVDGALDLGAARDEILGRLARLAGGAGADGIS